MSKVQNLSTIQSLIQKAKIPVNSLSELVQYLNNNQPWNEDNALLTKSDYDTYLQAANRLSVLGVKRLDQIQSLIAQGISSAHHISQLSKKSFNSKAKSILNGHAEFVFQKAKAVSHAVLHNYMVKGQSTQAYANSFKGSNFPDAKMDITDEESQERGEGENFEGIPSYSSQFGGLTNCTVPSGRSIFDPASYLTDLANLLDGYIDQNQSDNLEFYTRRRDILQTGLDGASTYDMVPTLDIVNNAMEVNLKENSDLYVNGQPLLTNTDDDLTSLTYPMRLPVNMSLQKVRSVCDLFGIPLSQFWVAAMNWEYATQDERQAINAEMIKISNSQYNLLLLHNYDESDLKELFGADGDGNPSIAPDANNEVDAGLFMSLTNLEQAGLLDILYDSLSEAEINSSQSKYFFVNRTATNAVDQSMAPMKYDWAENKIQNVTNLRLCRMNQVIRLSRILDWAYNEIDYALQPQYGVDTDNGAQDYGPIGNAIPYLANYAFTSINYGLSVDQSIAMAIVMQNYGEKYDGLTFLQSVFGTTLLNAEWDTSDLSSSISNQLKSSLNLKDSDLSVMGAAMIEWWKNYSDSGGSVVDGTSIKLISKVLTSMYRASLLREIFNLSLTELYFLSGLAYSPGSRDQLGTGSWGNDLFISTQSWKTNRALPVIVQAITWYKGNGLDYFTLRYMTYGTNDFVDASDNPINAGLLQAPTEVIAMSVSNDDSEAFYNELTNDLSPLAISNSSFTSFPDLSGLNNIKTLTAQLPQPNSSAQINEYPAGFKPQVLASNMNVDMQQVGYHDDSGIIVHIPDAANQLPLLQEYIYGTLLGQSGTLPAISELMQQLGNAVAFEKMESRYLAYFSDAAGDQVFSGQLVNLFDSESRITIEELKGIDLYTVNVSFTEDNNSKVIVSEVDADILLIDLQLSGYIDPTGEILNSPDLQLTRMQGFMNTQLANDPVQDLEGLISSLMSITPGTSSLDDGVRFIAYLQDTITGSSFASDLQGSYSDSQTDQQRVFSQRMGIFLNTDSGLNDYLFVMTQTRTGLDNPVQYFYEGDAGHMLYRGFLDVMRQSAVSAASLSYNNNAYRWYIQNYSNDYGTSPSTYPWWVIWEASGFQTLTNRYNDSNGVLLEALNATDQSEQIQQINAFSGWSSDDIESLIQNWGFSESQLLDLYNIQSLQQAFEVMQKTGLNGDNLALIGNTYDVDTSSGFDDVATLLESLLKATYSSENEWDEVFRPVVVALTELRRDACADLMLYAMGNSSNAVLNNISSRRELSEYLCTDVDMTGLVETSVVKESICAHQFYIYRCLMNIEPGAKVVDPEEFDMLWKWMQHFTTWQLNRKVFTYPENYISPEIGTVRSDSFQQFQSSLEDSNLTEDVIQDAFEDYLDEFTRVANLQISGAYLDDTYEYDSSQTDGQEFIHSVRTLYVVAHAKTTPYQHYYRTAKIVSWENRSEGALENSVVWSAWKSISLKLSDVKYVSPVFAFGRLYLFWIKYNENHTSGDNSLPYLTGTAYFSFANVGEDRWEGQQTLNANILASTDEYGNSYTSLSQVQNEWFYRFSLAYNNLGRGTICFASIIANGFITAGTEVHAAQMALHNQTYLNDAFTYNDAVNNKKINSIDLFKNEFAVAGSFLSGQQALLLPFEGNSDYLSYTTDNTQSVSTFTYHLFFRWEPENTAFCYILSPNLSNENAIRAAYLNSGSFNLVYGGNSSGDVLLIDQKLETGTWYRVILTGSAQTNQIDYIIETTVSQLTLNAIGQPDEQVVGSKCQIITTDGNFVSDADGSLYIGQGFNGSLMEMLVFDHVISADKLSGILPLDMLQFEPAPLAMLDLVDYEEYENNGNSLGSFFVNSDPNGLSIVEASDVQLPPTLSTDQHPIQFIGISDGVEISCGLATQTGIPAQLMSYAMSGWMAFDDYTGTGLLFNFHFEDPDNANQAINVYCQYDDANKAVNLRLTTDNTDTLVKEVTLFSTDPTNEKYVPEGTWVWFGVTVETNLIWGSTSQRCGVKVGYHVISSGINIDSSQPQSWSGSNAGYIYPNVASKYVTCTSPLLQLIGGLTGNIYGANLYASNVAGSLYETISGTPWTWMFGDLQTDGLVSDANLAFSLWGTPRPKMFTTLNTNYVLSPVSATAGNSPYECARIDSPAVNELNATFMQEGTEGLLTIESQKTKESDFSSLDASSNFLVKMPTDNINFFDANGIYYFELFFFAPWFAAQDYAAAHDYSNAKKWFNYIYNPSGNTDPNKSDNNDQYWNVLPFQANYNPVLALELVRTPQQQLQSELTGLPVAPTGAGSNINVNADALFLALALNLYNMEPDNANIQAYLRPIAFLKGMVMRYVQNLIDWGDQLFTENTLESINEAQVQYYAAWDLLGESPENVGLCKLPEIKSLGDIVYGDDVEIEGILIFIEDGMAASGVSASVVPTDSTSANNYIPNSYFGIPQNSQFVDYWAILEDRLFKIQHRLTIDGKPDYLPLFEPPIDFESLNHTVASGASLSTSSLRYNIPNYRFTVMASKAKEYCQQANNLSQYLLATLEKKDSQQLAELYNTQQNRVMNLMVSIREDNISAAQYSVDALNQALLAAEKRQKYFNDLLAKGLLSSEKLALKLNNASQAALGIGNISNLNTVGGYLAPTMFGTTNGGSHPGDALRAIAESSTNLGWQLSLASGLASTIGAHERTIQEWKQQQELTAYDIAQIQDQISAAENALESAKQDLVVLNAQIANEIEIKQYYQSKFTNDQLYTWMTNQLYGQYNKVYALVSEMVNYVQAAYTFELAEALPQTINSYWNSRYMGLLASENLYVGLIELEKKYLENNSRRKEIVVTISLKEKFEESFLELVEQGQCELMLDMDFFAKSHPSLYCMQIESIAFTLPALLAPYQRISAEVTQNYNRVLMEPDVDAAGALINGGDISGFSDIRSNYNANQQIALSTGMNDTGVLIPEAERYLPFEKTGAISGWTISIPKENNTGLLVPRDPEGFDSDQPVRLDQLKLNLSDLIVELNISAKTGGSSFRNYVWNSVQPKSYEWIDGSVRPVYTDFSKSTKKSDK